MRADFRQQISFVDEALLKHPKHGRGQYLTVYAGVIQIAVRANSVENALADRQILRTQEFALGISI